MKNPFSLEKCRPSLLKKLRRQTTLLMVLFMSVGSLLGTNAHAAPKKDLWLFWRDNAPYDTQTVDHSPWQYFLKKYTVAAPEALTLVDYAAVTKEDEERLDLYLEYLGRLNPAAFNQDVQLAYWINLYNALTVRVILTHYPVASIRDINLTKSWFNKGPWDAKLITIRGQELSLNDIEHRILRPIWDDPLIHYALNCGAMGCPALAQTPYTGKNVHEQLMQAGRAFINSERGVDCTPENLTISKIYDWYTEDFGGTETTLLAHLRRYAEPDLQTCLEAHKGYDDTEYDWALNQVVEK